MANPKTLRTVSAAISLELHAQLKVLVASKRTTVGRILASAIQDLVGDGQPPKMSQGQVAQYIFNLEMAVTKLTAQANRTYPPDLATAASKVLTALRDAKPLFMDCDNDGRMERSRLSMVHRVSELITSATSDSKALARTWKAALSDTK